MYNKTDGAYADKLNFVNISHPKEMFNNNNNNKKAHIPYDEMRCDWRHLYYHQPIKSTRVNRG